MLSQTIAKALLFLSIGLVLSCRSATHLQLSTFHSQSGGQAFGDKTGRVHTTLACPVSPDGYMLTAAHGLRPGIEIGIPNRDGSPLIITSLSPPEGYFASRPPARWTKEDPAQFAPARVVKDFRPDKLDLALIKVEGINVPYFEIAAKPEAGGRSFQVPENPLTGREKLRTAVMKIEDRGSGAHVAWVEHEFVKGDSGSALLDSSGRLVGLLNRIHTMSYGPLSQFDGIDKATLGRIIAADRQAKASTAR